LYSSLAAATVGMDWDTDSARASASLRSCHEIFVWLSSGNQSGSGQARCKWNCSSLLNAWTKQVGATFCWCFRGKAVGYAALTMDGPFRENMGALIAPCEITWKDQSTLD
jgi:hypothetical protein